MNENIVTENMENKVEAKPTQQNKDNRFFKKDGFRRDAGRRFSNPRDEEYSSLIVSVRQVSKTREGGRRMSYSVLLLIGNRNGSVGVGGGKSTDISEAIRKAEQNAKKSLIFVPMFQKRTIVHNVQMKFCASTVSIRQAKPGTGIVAGGVAWHVFDLLGMKDVVCKCIGATSSKHNVISALMKCFKNVSSINEISHRRNKEKKDLLRIEK
jgi:small subunit ribosomal protein S5